MGTRPSEDMIIGSLRTNIDPEKAFYPDIEVHIPSALLSDRLPGCHGQNTFEDYLRFNPPGLGGMPNFFAHLLAQLSPFAPLALLALLP